MCPDEPKNKEQEPVNSQSPSQNKGEASKEIGDTQASIAKAAAEKLDEKISFEEAKEIWKQIPAVMVVDDEVAILRAMKRVFKIYVADRNSIVTFSAPEEALAHVEQLPAHSLIFCDNSMGSPMQGVDLAQEIARVAAEKQLIFILHTSDNSDYFEKQLKKGLSEGWIDGYVAKPATTHEALETCAMAAKRKLPEKS